MNHARMTDLGRAMTWLMGIVLMLAGSATGETLLEKQAEAHEKVESEKRPVFADDVRPKVHAIIEEMAAGEDVPEAKERANAQFDRVIAFARDQDADLFIEAARTRRLAEFLTGLPSEQRTAVARLMVESSSLATTMAFLVDQKHDHVRQVFTLLHTLNEARPEQVRQFPQLAAAIAVVHETPLVRQINENRTQAVEPLRIFDFYVEHRRQMQFGIENVPADLMTYIVDSTASIEEMEWALRNYRGDRAIGKRFFDIEYDYDHYYHRTPKKVTQLGFNLPNIKQYGGVCADQAYFAVAVGKSIGVPTAYTTGRGASVGHAWVGFFQSRGRSGGWNFNYGRYEVYQGVEGRIHDPQTRQQVADGYVSVLAELIGTDLTDRATAAAMTEAAIRLGELREQGQTLPEPSEEFARIRRQPRDTSVESQLALLKGGLNESPGYAEGWLLVADLAKRNELTLDQKKEWADTLDRLCGQSYPDFSLMILEPMIQSVEDVEVQNGLWEKFFRRFTRRKDLAARVRINQGDLWREHGDKQKAAVCYQDVINRFANAGPFVLTALDRLEEMLRDADRASKIPLVYEQTFSKIRPPGKMASEIKRHSNWYKVAVRFRDYLRSVGMTEEAEKIDQQIEREVGAG